MNGPSHEAVAGKALDSEELTAKGCAAETVSSRAPAAIPATPLVSINVVCAVLRRGKHFLAACRPEGYPHAGLWEFPGGKVEPGETPEQALVREISEELGVGLHEFSLWKTLAHDYPQTDNYPARRVTLHVFMVDSFSGEPVPVEGQGLRWVSPAEAMDLPFLEADVAIVQELATLLGATFS